MAGSNVILTTTATAEVTLVGTYISVSYSCIHIGIVVYWQSEQESAYFMMSFCVIACI